MQELNRVRFVDTASHLGRAVFAGADLREGDVLWKETPLAFMQFPSTRCVFQPNPQPVDRYECWLFNVGHDTVELKLPCYGL